MIEELASHKKIFITGLYGTGKSTLLKKIVAERKGHTWLDFDDIVGYGVLGSRFDLLYQLLNNLDTFVLDALPHAGSNESWERFHNYVLESGTIIVLTKCDFDIWYSERLKNKVFANTDDINVNRSHYDNFYNDEHGIYQVCKRVFDPSVLRFYNTN